MISNDERREEAARMRFTDHNMTWSECCFCIAYNLVAAPIGNEHDDVLAFAHALADLIDRPTTTRHRKFRTKYGRKTPCCEVCGYSIGDMRWNYCPKCGTEIVEYGVPNYCYNCGMEIEK